jgi:sugar phosphate isomerase/epimerase
VPEMLQRVRTMGFTTVEISDLFGLSARQFRRSLDDAGLTCPSLIPKWDEVKSQTGKVMEEASILGAKFLPIGWLPHDGPFTIALATQYADQMEEVGELVRQNHMQLAYHPHGYEFQSGTPETALDIIFRRTHQRNLVGEMDVFWMARAGQDPVAWLRKYRGRWAILHLKDLAMGTAINDTTGLAPDSTSVPVGSGMIDFPAVLREAQKQNIDSMFIEDESALAMEQIPKSLDYLRHVKL